MLKAQLARARSAPAPRPKPAARPRAALTSGPGLVQPNHRAASTLRVDVAAAVEHARRAPALDMPRVAGVAHEFGLPWGALEVHAGGPAGVACGWLGARAFAVQNVVVFADAAPSLALARHELAHVVQQRGIARPAPERYGLGSLALGPTEGAAEWEARAAAQGERPSELGAAPAAVYRETQESVEETAKERAKRRLQRLAENTSFLDVRADAAKDPVFGMAKTIPPDPAKPDAPTLLYDPVFLLSSAASWSFDDFKAKADIGVTPEPKSDAETGDAGGAGESTFASDLGQRIFKRKDDKLDPEAIAVQAFEVQNGSVPGGKASVWAVRAVPGAQIQTDNPVPITQHYAFVGAYAADRNAAATEAAGENSLYQVVNEISRDKRSEADPEVSLKAYRQILAEIVRTAAEARPAKKDLPAPQAILDAIRKALESKDPKIYEAAGKSARDDLKTWVLANFKTYDELYRIVLNDEKKVLKAGETIDAGSKEKIPAFNYISNWNPIKGDILARFIAERKAEGVTVSAKQVYFSKTPEASLNEDARADGFVEKSGAKPRIIESKAVASGPAEREIAQMGRYAIIIRNRIVGRIFKEPPSSFPPEGDSKLPKPDEKTFDAVEYYIGVSTTEAVGEADDRSFDIAVEWNEALYRAFGLTDSPGPLPPRKGVQHKDYYIHPNVTGDPAKFTTIQLNPLLTLPIGAPKQRKQTATDVAVKQPGAKVLRADFILVRPMEAPIASGTVVVAIDMAGQVKSPDQPEPKALQPLAETDAKPAKPGGPIVYGKVENKFDKLTSALDKFLTERVTTDAKLTDAGATASIIVKKGPSGLPNLLIEAEISAAYNARGLTAKGSIGLSNEKGNIHGSATVTWNASAKQWKIAGSVTFADVVDGLKPITGGFTYDPATDTTQITVKEAGIEKRYGAILLTGSATDLLYDTKTGDFSGAAALTAKLGAFGEAAVSGVRIEKSQIQSATLSYKTPELKYPKTNPALAGSLTGSVTYTAAETPGGGPTFGGRIEVDAEIKAAPLRKLAKDGKLGVKGAVEIDKTGAFSGSVGTTEALTLGEHFRIAPFDAKVKEDGAFLVEFTLEVVNIGALKDAKATAQIDDKGFRVLGAGVNVAFGSDRDKVWGELAILYKSGRAEGDLTVGGGINVRIKEGMIAHGQATYDVRTGKVNATLAVDEITLLKFGPEKRSIVDFSKQVELISFYKVIGIYLDVGFDLAFVYEFDLRLSPSVTLEGFSFRTFSFTSAKAIMRLLGKLEASLGATPWLGLGVFVISTKLLRGGGGVKIPIVGKATLALDENTVFHVTYAPDEGVSAGGSAGLTLLFGIAGAVTPYAEFVVLDGAYRYPWESADPVRFEILKERPIFTYRIDFGKPLKTDANPPIPKGIDAPAAPSAKQAVAGRPTDAPKLTAASKDKEVEEQTPDKKPEADAAGGFDLKTIADKLKDGEAFRPIRRVIEAAAEVWEAISNFVGRIVKFIRNWVGGLVDDIVDAVNGIGKMGLVRYIRELLRKRLHPALFSILEPMFDALATIEDDIYDLLDTKLPTSVSELLEFVVTIIQKVIGLVWDGLTTLVEAIGKMIDRARTATRDFAQYLVDTGRIGVTRSVRYIGIDTIGAATYFLLADHYKIHFAGVDKEEEDDTVWPSADKAIGWGLWHALDWLDVTPTYTKIAPDADEPYNDYWVSGVQRQTRWGAGLSPAAPGAAQRAAAEPGLALPPGLRARYEDALQTDLGGIELHMGCASAEAASALDAHAFTIGRHVHFGAGAYAPDTEAGDRLLAHELTHAAAFQGWSPSAPRRRFGFEVASPTGASEREADAAARRAMSQRRVSG